MGDFQLSSPSERWCPVIRHIREGSEVNEAVEEMYRLLSGKIKGRIKNSLGRQVNDLSDDVLQELVIALVDAIRERRLTEDMPVWGYVAGVTWRCIARQLEFLKPAAKLQDELAKTPEFQRQFLYSQVPDPYKAAYLNECVVEVWERTEKLPERDREAFIRVFMLDQSDKEARRKMGMKAGQFASVKRQAVRQVRTNRFIASREYRRGL